jgi:hypothetical protein
MLLQPSFHCEAGFPLVMPSVLCRGCLCPTARCEPRFHLSHLVRCPNLYPLLNCRLIVNLVLHPSHPLSCLCLYPLLKRPAYSNLLCIPCPRSCRMRQKFLPIFRVQYSSYFLSGIGVLTILVCCVL